MRTETNRFLLKDKDGNFDLVSFDEIVYIESMQNYCKIFTQEKRYVEKISLNKINEITQGKFFRCHKQFLVNIDYLKNIKLLYNESDDKILSVKILNVEIQFSRRQTVEFLNKYSFENVTKQQNKTNFHT